MVAEEDSRGSYDEDESGTSHDRTQALSAARPSSSREVPQPPATHKGEENVSLHRENEIFLGPMESTNFSAEGGTQNEWFILCHDEYKYSGKALHIPVERDTHDI